MRVALRRFAVVGSVRAGAYGAGAVTSLLLVRWLGPDEFGEYALGAAWFIGLATLADLGGAQLTLRELADDPRRLPHVRRFAWRRSVVPVIVAALGFLVLRPAGGGTAAALIVAAAVGFVGVLRRDASALWITRGPSAAIVGEAAGVPIVQMVLLGVLTTAGLRATGAGALACLAAAGVLVAIVQRLFVPRSAAAVDVSTRSWPRAANALAAVDALNLLPLYAFTVVIGATGSAGDVAVFVVASRLSALVAMPLAIATSSVVPKLRLRRGEEARAEMQRAVTETTRIASAGAVIAALAAVLSMPWVLHIFGDGFGGLWWPLAVLLVAQLVNSGCGPVARLLLLNGHERGVRSEMVVATTAGLCLAVISSPRFGALGAAFGASFMLVLLNLRLAILAHKQLGILAGPVGPRRSQSYRSGRRAWQRREVNTASCRSASTSAPEPGSATSFSSAATP